MISIFSSVTDGKLNKVASKEIADTLKQFEGKRVEVIIKRLRSKRSLKQNAYMWGCVIPIIRQGLKDLGYLMSPDEVHEFLKDKFLDYETMATSDGLEIGRKYKSTTEITKTEFCEYINQIQIWSAEILGIVIPDPNTSEQLF